MIKIEAKTLSEAMEQASAHYDCSVTELKIEVIQHPKKGMMGMFQKPAIIVAVRKPSEAPVSEKAVKKAEPRLQKTETVTDTPKQKRAKEGVKKEKKSPSKPKRDKRNTENKREEKKREESGFVSSHHDIIAPTSLVTAQDDYESYFEEEDFDYSAGKAGSDYKSKSEVLEHIAKHEEEETEIKRVKRDRFDNNVVDNFFESRLSMDDVVKKIDEDINRIFRKACFEIDEIKVSAYEENSVLIEFSGKDAALLIGKEGYRYKALSYMIFNWINAKYGLQLRLEIAEFLKNQEEMVHKYLESVCTQVENDGRAQTKILDGVLVQIALRRLRATFPNKYVAIRTNRDGLKYIIINSFRSNGNA